jgi:hypothetical protein
VNQDFRDLLREFCDQRVEFLVVGAYAMAVHGLPRATGDIDVWIRPTPDNAQRVWRALTAFGAPLDALTINDLGTPGTVFQIGLPPRRIDVLTGISGVAFDDAWPRRQTARFGDVDTPVLGLDDLIVNKAATGRPKDLLDRDSLLDVRGR